MWDGGTPHGEVLEALVTYWVVTVVVLSLLVLLWHLLETRSRRWRRRG